MENPILFFDEPEGAATRPHPDSHLRVLFAVNAAALLVLALAGTGHALVCRRAALRALLPRHAALFGWAAGLEQHSTHPLAAAITVLRTGEAVVSVLDETGGS